MNRKISLSGQWTGFFVYGPEYGEKMHGEKVQFRLFLQETDDGQFEGKGVDIEGIGANFDEAVIKGFMEGTFISFTKEYEEYFFIEDGNKILDADLSPFPRLSYTGEYNERSKTFSGQWEIWTNERSFDTGTLVDIGTGFWEMIKDV